MDLDSSAALYIGPQVNLGSKYADRVIGEAEAANILVSHGVFPGNAPISSVGYRADTGLPAGDRQRLEMVSERTGVRIPREIEPASVIEQDSRFPFVVKHSGLHRGRSVYMIKGFVEWLKFASWRALEPTLGEIYSDSELLRRVKSIRDEICDGIIPDAFASDGWQTLEYIHGQTPRPASLRMIVDATEQIHQAVLFIGPYSLDGSALLNRPEARFKGYFDEYGAYPTQAFLEDEHFLGGLFYLGSPVVASNINPQAVPLDGQPKKGEEREILEMLGINPVEPRAPETLKETARKAARLFRGDRLYCGLDFGFGADAPVLFENNDWPGISPHLIGMGDLYRYYPDSFQLELGAREVLSRLFTALSRGQVEDYT